MHIVRIPIDSGEANAELRDVLDCFADGTGCKWSILWLEMVGDIGKPVSVFENEIQQLENGLVIEWPSLIKLSQIIDQTLEVLIIGDPEFTKLKRYSNQNVMYETCQHVIELLDSSFWLIHTKDSQIAEKLKSKLHGKEQYV